MAYAFVAGNSYQTPAGVGNYFAPTMPAAAVAGDLAIAVVEVGDPLTQGTSTAPPGWTFVPPAGTAVPLWLNVWYRVVQSGDAGTTFTWTVPSGLPTWVGGIWVWSGGPSTGNPVAGLGWTQLNGGSSVTAPAATADTSSDMLLCMFLGAGGAVASQTMSVPAGMASILQYSTGTANAYPSLTLATLQLSASGTTPAEASATSSGTANLAAAAIVLTVAGPPYAPTVSSPPPGQYIDVSGGLSVIFAYNGDGAPMTDYQIEIDGQYWTGSAWSGTAQFVPESVTSVTLPAGGPLTNGAAHTLVVNTEAFPGVGTATTLTFNGEAAPTVTVSAPTGSNTSPNPPITWAGGFPTGLGQTASRAMVYSAAQYGAGGFSPGFGPSVYDSGVVTGAGTSQTPSGVPATGAFRAYVQVSDGHQWSAWGFLGFTMAVAVPLAPALTATWSQATASATLVATGATTFDSQPTYASFYSSDDGGSTWQLVRNGSNVSLSTGTAALVDYEGPAVGARQYIAYANALVSGSVLTSPASSAAIAMATVASWWLKNPLNYQQNIAAVVSADFATDRLEQSSVIYPLGQDRPSVIFDVLTGQDGSATITTTTQAQFTALQTILASQAVLLLQSPYGFNSYVRLALGGGGGSAQETDTLSASSAASPFRTTVVSFLDVGLGAVPITS